MDYINAFWVGGLICALTQILLDRTKLMPGRIMVLLVCSGSVLGALKIYPVIQEYAGAGASVPLLGFGNLLWKGVKEAVDKEGFPPSAQVLVSVVEQVKFQVCSGQSRSLLSSTSYVLTEEIGRASCRERV